jgi:hypothetical protein
MINTTRQSIARAALITPTLARHTDKRENFARLFRRPLRLSNVTVPGLKLYAEDPKLRESERNRPDGHAGDSRSRAAARANAAIARVGIPEKQVGGVLGETTRSEP